MPRSSSLTPFWGAELLAGAPVSVVPPAGFVLNVQLAALAERGTPCSTKYVVSVQVPAFTANDGGGLVLCTLRSEGGVEQQRLDLTFSSAATFSLQGAPSAVHLSGFL